MVKKLKKESKKKQVEQGKYCCSVCGREISGEDYEAYDGRCWECWDDQMTEGSEMMFGDLM